MKWLRYIPFGLTLAEYVIDKLIPQDKPDLSAAERAKLAAKARETLRRKQ